MARLRSRVQSRDREISADHAAEFRLTHYPKFVADDTVMRAVLFDLAVIGEAAKGISASTRSRFPSVPWSEMAGLRDVVIHQYFGIDANVVWRAATVSVPTVVDVLRHA